MYGAEPDLLSFLVATGFGAFWLYERYQDHADPGVRYTEALPEHPEVA